MALKQRLHSLKLFFCKNESTAIEPYTFSQRLETRLKERDLKREWVENTIENPEVIEEIAVDETHFFKKILEADSRCLKVVFNPLSSVVITAHFDRKRTKNNCQ